MPGIYGPDDLVQSSHELASQFRKPPQIPGLFLPVDVGIVRQRAENAHLRQTGAQFVMRKSCETRARSRSKARCCSICWRARFPAQLFGATCDRPSQLCHPNKRRCQCSQQYATSDDCAASSTTAPDRKTAMSSERFT